MPGSTVLVIGPGAGGGEVLGALSRGCNVVAVEKDEYQFNQLQAHLLQVKGILKKELQSAKGGQDDGSSSLSQSFPPGSQYQPPPEAVEDGVEEIPKCLSCGMELLEDGVKCETEDCEDTGNLYHVACTVKVGERIVCRDCKRYQDEDDASQAATQVEE